MGPVDQEFPRSHGEDYAWLLRAAKVAPVVAVQELLVTVHWHRSSFFADPWPMIILSPTYFADKHREPKQEPSRPVSIYGQIALAHATLGERRPAQHRTRRRLSLDPRERRAYLALAVSLVPIPAATVVRLANAAGKGS